MDRDPKAQRDGYISVIGGQDAGKSPSLIAKNQAAELWNITVRGGFPKSRPGFFQHPFDFPTDEIAEWFESELHQGSVVFQPRGLNPVQIWSVGGRLFIVDILNGGTVLEITPSLQVTTTANFIAPAIGADITVNVTDASLIYDDYPVVINGKTYDLVSKSGNTLTVTNIEETPTTVIVSGAIVSYLDPNSRTASRVWFLKAERFLIVQDGLSKPIIFDGAKTWRSNPQNKEIPTGTIMAYGQGRITVAITPVSFVVGDIIYGPSGTQLYGYADAILKFTENAFLAGGGSFTIPFEAGEITAMEFLPVWDTSSGQGPLIVFTNKSASSVNLSPVRETWANTQSPIQSILMRGSGPVSQWSTVSGINGDIFFRSKDGIRSLLFAVRDFGMWSNTPLSTELNNVLSKDDERLMQWSSAIIFDNRLLMTVGTRNTQYRSYFKGIGALDFHTISGMGQQSQPVYDGVWVGIDIWQLFSGEYNGKERAFAAVRNADGRNELWEITKDAKFDNTDGRIVSTIFSRSFFFENPLEIKRIENCEIWVDDVIGTVDYTLKYRPDQYPCWYDFGSAQSVCTTYRNCDGVEDCAPLAPTYRPGYKTRLAFGQPTNDSETNDGKPARLGYEFQVMLQWEGHCALRKLRLRAIEQQEPPSPRIS